MAEDPEAETLAGWLLEGLEHLQGGRAAQAVSPLQRVCDHPGLQVADDLVDVRARAHSLLAQALLEADRPEEARKPHSVALQLAREEDDAGGLAVLAELGQRIEAACARVSEQAAARERAARLAALSIDEIEGRVRSEPARVEVLVRKANAESDAGRSAEAVVVAERALAGAVALGDPRLQVLARLSIARASSDRAPEELAAALQCADAASEPGLITAVAKAAELHGVSLPTQPQAGARS